MGSGVCGKPADAGRQGGSWFGWHSARVRDRVRDRVRRLGALVWLCGWMVAGLALALAPAQAAQRLPPEVALALQRAKVPQQAISVVVQDATSGRSLLSWREHRPVNPASLTKLLTTHAALERLGPAWTWATPVWLDGQVTEGVLDGNLVIKGSGDPGLVLERLWLLLRRVQQFGVREIAGDIVLDGSAFNLPEVGAGDFDGEALRPYNVTSAALIFNFRTVTYRFVPDLAAGVARITAEPLLAGLQVDTSVPLISGPCSQWRESRKASFEPSHSSFEGAFPSSCGELQWHVADPEPATYEARLIAALWQEMGGTLRGRVRPGLAPVDQPPRFEQRSPALAEVVRDINKFSNNLMAQQLFLTLAAQAQPQEPVTPEAARLWLTQWLVHHTGPADEDLLIDNGSGLSRHTRISASRLARLLQQAWDSPVMSELMSSLPISGTDGTLRRSRATPGRAHLKTGTLRDVTAVAGYVLTHSGRRLIVVAIIQHPLAPNARLALEAVVQWALSDSPQR